MTRDELTALRDAIDITLALPDSIREMLAKWLTPAAAKPNGHDPCPPVLRPSPRTVKVQAARRVKPTPAQAAEKRLLTAMRDNPGLSVVALANAAGSSRSATGERLRQLDRRGVVEKDHAGDGNLKGEEPRAEESSPTERPTIAPSS
jgi:hypothetical protein